MKKFLVLGLAWTLIGCVHGRGGGVSALLQDLPAENMGAVLFTKDTLGVLEFLRSETTAIEKLVGANVQAEMIKDLGFNPLTPQGMIAAGIDPNRHLAVWAGGSSPKKALIQGILPIANRTAFLATLDKVLAKGSLSRGSSVATAKGDWIGFSRTNGQKTESAGGLLVQGDIAVFTNGEREDLQAFSTGPSAAQHPHLVTLMTASAERGQLAVFLAPEWLEKFNDDLMSRMPGAEAGYLEVRMTPDKEIFFEGLSLSLPEALAQARRLTPAPVAPVPAPKGGVLAGVGTVNMQEAYTLVKKDERVAKVIAEQREIAGQIEPILPHLGTDLTFTLGVDGEPANPMVLLGSIFVRLDLAGGNPQAALETAVAAAKEMNLPLDKLKAVEGGYDLFIPPIVLIRFRATGEALSISYGREAAPDPESRLMKLAKGHLQAGFFDAAKVGRMVSKMLVKVPAAAKLGLVLQRYGQWEQWGTNLGTVSAAYGRVLISP